MLRQHSPVQPDSSGSPSIDDVVVVPIDFTDPSDFVFDSDDEQDTAYHQFMDRLNMIDFSGEFSDSDSDDDESGVVLQRKSEKKGQKKEKQPGKEPKKKKVNNSRQLAHRLLYVDDGKVARETMSEFDDIICNLLFSDEKGFEAGRPVTLEDVDEMIKACGITDADSDVNSERITQLIRQVLDSAENLNRSEAWKEYIAVDDKDLLKRLPLLKALQVSKLVLRDAEDTRPSEILVTKGMIKDHLDALVVANGDAMSWFGVQRSTTDMDSLTPAKLCTGSTADEGLRHLHGVNPYSTKGNDRPLGSTLMSPYMSARHKPVTNGRPMARQVELMRSLPNFDANTIKQQTTSVPREDRVDREHGKSQFCPPYAGVVYRCYAGGNSDFLPSPEMILGAKGLGGVHVRDELNKLTVSVRDARQVPPLYPSIMALRLLPAASGGCSLKVLTESAYEKKIPRERKLCSALRDKLQLLNLVRDIARTDLKLLNSLLDTPDHNMIYSSIFDELGEDAQFTYILQICDALTEVYELMILDEEYANLVTKWRLYERLRYISCVRDWVLSEPKSRARKDADRRRRRVLTMLPCAPIGERNLIRFGVPPEEAHELRIKTAFHRCICPAEIARGISTGSFRRFSASLENQRNEFQSAEFPGSLFQCPHDEEDTARSLEKELKLVQSGAICPYILFELRASMPSTLYRTRSLTAQLCTCLWNLRDSLHAGVSRLSNDVRFAMSIACGSKLLGLEVNRMVILFHPDGPVSHLVKTFITPVEGLPAHPMEEDLVRHLENHGESVHLEMMDILSRNAQGGSNRNPYSRFVTNAADIVQALDEMDNIQRSERYAHPPGGVISIQFAAYDRSTPGTVKAIVESRTERFKLVSVWSPACRAFLSVEVDNVKINAGEKCRFTGFHRVDTEYSQLVFYLWEIMAALITCEWALTKRAHHAYNTDQQLRTHSRNYAEHLELLLELDKSCRYTILQRERSTRLIVKPAPGLVLDERHAVCIHRVSNSAESFLSGYKRVCTLIHSLRIKYVYVHHVFLYCVKGTEAVPIDPRNRVSIRSVKRGDVPFPRGDPAKGVPKDAELCNIPFVSQLMEHLVGDNPHDVFVPSISRVCCAGALHAFAERARINPNNARFFSWDLSHAGLASQSLGGPKELGSYGEDGELLRADGSVRMELMRAFGVVGVQGASGRMFRYVTDYRYPIWSE